MAIVAVGCLMTATGPAYSEPLDAPALADSIGQEVLNDAMAVSINDDNVISVLPPSAGAAVEVEISSDAAEGLTLKQDGLPDVTLGLPSSAQTADLADSVDGVAYYDNNDGSSTVPLVKEDGEVQVLTVIEDSSAPTRYGYEFGLPEGGRVVDAGEGYFVVLGMDGRPVASITPVWAKDANGNEVPTWYELDGDSLVQVVSHGPGTEYPVVADPAIRGRLIKSVGLVASPLGTTVRVTPQNPWSVVIPYDYWVEYKLWVNSAYEGRKYENQLLCHVNFAPFKTPWNLDSWRPDVSCVATVAAACNP